MGKDVAEALGYKNTADAIGKHIDTDDKLTSQIAIAGQRRGVVVINESGLYSLILSIYTCSMHSYSVQNRF